MERKENKKAEIIRIFPKEIRGIMEKIPISFEKIQEIRMRAEEPLLVVAENKEYYIGNDGEIKDRPEKAFRLSAKQLRETVEHMGSYSLYAYEEEIRQGYLTIEGGHRVGLAGKTVVEHEDVRTMRYISFLNIRISHEIKGCANQVLPYLYSGGKMLDTLVISPPRCGKTTMLRDIIRQASNGNEFGEAVTVGVIDERAEIGACYQGVPQNDLGIRTDVLDCCPKARGMMMMIRSMSPQVVAVDEIGGKEDLEALQYVKNCGCRLLATVHGTSMDDIRQKPMLGNLVKEKAFERYVVLDGREKCGQIKRIFDSMGNSLFVADMSEG